MYLVNKVIISFGSVKGTSVYYDVLADIFKMLMPQKTHKSFDQDTKRFFCHLCPFQKNPGISSFCGFRREHVKVQLVSQVRSLQIFSLILELV